MPEADPLRAHLGRLLDWRDAHVSFDQAVADFPSDLRDVEPDHLPYSAWQLVEHMRLCQADILDFCVNPAYAEPQFPDDYWPADARPTSPTAWDTSVAAFQTDRETLRRLVADPATDLFARIPHGQGQTILREILLVADHNAYHVGQLIVVRRLLGCWD